MSFMVACGQFTPNAGDIEANSSTMREQMAAATAAGARLIVFPELALTGYLMPEEIAPLAVDPAGPEVNTLAETAHKHGIDIAFGFAEQAGEGRIYNSMAYLNSGGEIVHIYRKVHLWDSERCWAEPGPGLDAFDTEHARTGMCICYDTRFPEAARVLAVHGATLLLIATAWLGPADEWELAVRARAMDNGMYVATSALQGTHPPFIFHGGSLIVDPHGHVLAQAEEGTDAVITAIYDEDVLQRFRQRLPLLEHRRLDVYEPLLCSASW